MRIVVKSFQKKKRKTDFYLKKNFFNKTLKSKLKSRGEVENTRAAVFFLLLLLLFKTV